MNSSLQVLNSSANQTFIKDQHLITFNHLKNTPMKNITSLLVLLLTVQLCSAQWFGNKKVSGNGDVITKTFKTDDYDFVAVNNSLDVELVEGKEGTITVTAESNIMEHLEIETDGDRLTVGVKKGINISTRKGIKVLVPVQSISGVSMAGSGDIISDMVLRNNKMSISVAGSGDITLHTESENLNVSIAGSGDVKLNGRTENLDASIAGSGDIEAYGLKANNVTASVAGSGDIAVFCNGGKIKASVIGSGDINYKGTASDIDKSVMGSGDITKK
jgi:hypothetical protein